MSTAWTITDNKVPDYVPPSISTPAWVWSIVGWGYDQRNAVNVVSIRLDYVRLDASGNFIRVNNFRPGWSSGDCTQYIPIFMLLNEGDVGGAGGTFVAGYDYWASQGANVFWKNYIYKFLYGMRSLASLTVYYPLPALLP